MEKAIFKLSSDLHPSHVGERKCIFRQLNNRQRQVSQHRCKQKGWPPFARHHSPLHTRRKQSHPKKRIPLIKKSLGGKRPSRRSSASYSLQSNSTVTPVLGVTASSACHRNDDKTQETSKHLIDDSSRFQNDSWSNLPLTSHKSESSHKDCLSQSINEGNKPFHEEDKQADAYTLFQCFTPPTLSAVQALKLCGPDKLISASYDDSYVHVWNVSGFKPVQSVKVSSSVQAVDTWSYYLAIGSSIVQMVDISNDGNDELRRIIFVEDSEPIPSSSSPSQFVAFLDEKGHLATARADSTVVKVWPPPPPDSNIVTAPETRIHLAGKIQGLSATRNLETSLLAVIIEEEKTCCKSVCLTDWKTCRDQKRIMAGSDTPSVSILVAFSPDARQISIGSGRRVDICETGSGAHLFHFNTDASICSVVYSHDGTQLAVGLSTGEVKVSDPLSNQHLFTLRDPVTHTKKPSSATSLSYSEDDKMFATGYQNGDLKLWKASTGSLGMSDTTSHCLKNLPSSVHGMELYYELEPLLARLKTLDLQFNENEKYNYFSDDDGFTLVIPKGAIIGDHKVQVAVMKYGPIGPFEYPDGYKPVSPIVWLCSSQKKFHLPLEVILPHCSDLENLNEDSSQTQLVFLKAGHNEYIRNTNGQKMFQFKQVDAQPLFKSDSPYGSLHTNHCCFYCVGVYNKEDTDKAKYMLRVVKPQQTTSNYTISICLMLDLPTCRKALDEQFEECNYVDLWPVKFANRIDAALKIKIKRELAENAGWLITVQSSTIYVEDVSDFWQNFETPAALVQACRNRLYPPRFNIDVSAKHATRNTYIEVLFEGAVRELKTEIPLECPTRLAQNYPPGALVLPHSQLNIATLSGNSSPTPTGKGVIVSSEHENSESSGLRPQLKHFNGWVQQMDTLD